MTRISSEKKKSSSVHPKPKEEKQLKTPKRLRCLGRNSFVTFQTLNLHFMGRRTQFNTTNEFPKERISLRFQT